MYEITVSKAGNFYSLVVSSDRAVSKPRYFKTAEAAISEANELALYYNDAQIVIERKMTIRDTQEKFGGTLTDYQAAVYTELHNCE